jgi:ubiquinone/menaquinone biosynthesis C-methylase UbiE
MSNDSSDDLTYALGSTNAEHDRLIRQATIFNPITERFLSDAGVGPGQRVLDIGSGLGDVSMLVGRMVGPSGEVVGIDNDASAIAKAKTRARKAGLRNISFIQSDLGRLSGGEFFDSIVRTIDSPISA